METISSNHGEPVDGGLIHFNPPITGARANLTGNPATIASGSANVTATANAYYGSYLVTASASGGVNTIDFHLTNLYPHNLFLPLVVK